MTGATVRLGATSLMYACQQGKQKQVYEIIKSKPGSILERERSLRTALHYCAESGSGGVESAGALLKVAPELVSAQDQDGYTALHLAVIAGNSSLARLLISHRAPVNARDNEGHTPAHWATVCGETECLELLLQKGADPNLRDMHGGSPLHYAAQMCGPGSEMPADRSLGMTSLRLLIQYRANPNIADNHGRQPVLWAASAGSSEAILILSNAGANVEAADQDGLTALHCAASRGHTDCVQTLVTLCNADADVIDNNGCSALFYAVTLGHADCTQTLLNYGANTSRQDRKGRTAMHCGAAKGQMETLKVIWARGGNLWSRTARGDYPLHEAVTSGRCELVSWLLSLRPDAVNAPNNDGRCPLHLAAIHNNIEMCKILLDAGSLVNPVMRTAKGLLATPLDAALHKGHRGTAKYLQLHGGVPAGRLNSESAALRGPNTRGTTIGIQQPVEMEKIDVPSNYNQSKIPHRGVVVPGEGQKVLQVFVEDGVMIKSLKHSQVEEKRNKRRRRKRKSKQSKVTQKEKEIYWKDTQKESSEETDTSQSSISDSKVSNSQIDKKEVDESMSKNNELEPKTPNETLITDIGKENNKEDSEYHQVTINRVEVEIHPTPETLQAESHEFKNHEIAIENEPINEHPIETNESREMILNEQSVLTTFEIKEEESRNEEDADLAQSEILNKGEEDANEITLDTFKTNENKLDSIPDSLKESSDQLDNNSVTKDDANESYAQHETNEESIKNHIDKNTKEEINVSSDEVINDEKEKPAASADNATNQFQSNSQTNLENEAENDELYDSLEDIPSVVEGSESIIDSQTGTKEEKSQEDSVSVEKKVIDGNDTVRTSFQSGSSEHVSETNSQGSEFDKSDKEVPENVFHDNKNEEYGDLIKTEIHLDSKTQETKDEDTSQIQEEHEEVSLLETSPDLQKSVSLTSESNNTLKDIGPHLLDKKSVAEITEKSKPKRKEWKRQRSREKWEPRSVSPSEKPTHDPGGNIKSKEKKNAITGMRPKSKTRIPRMCRNGEEFDNSCPISPVSVTQAVQYSVRKYQLERRIFHQLLELKRLQIRAGRSSESVLVKRLVDDYRRAGLMLGLQQYNGVYTFRAFEKYLYDQLRLLQSSEKRIIPRLRSSDDLEKLTSALKKTKVGQDLLTTIPNNPVLCTNVTHRCHHATHAYTGIPCAAYIRRNHHTMPKPGSFLPKLVNGEKEGELAKSLRFVDPTRPLTLELSHGTEKQVITLPTEKLDKSKRYFVTFTIKTGNQKKSDPDGHLHASSV